MVKWGIKTDSHPGGIHRTLPILSSNLVRGQREQRGQETKSKTCQEVTSLTGDPAP